MDTTYGKAVALAVPVFLALIAIGILVDVRRRTKYYWLADAINSLSCGIVSTGMRVFFGLQKTRGSTIRTERSEGRYRSVVDEDGGLIRFDRETHNDSERDVWQTIRIAALVRADAPDPFYARPLHDKRC